MKRLFLAILLIVFSATAVAATDVRIRCASTTSTGNSGLFGYILPIFEKKTGIKVDVVAVGTGAAIEIGRRGDADVVFVHAKQQELKVSQRTDKRRLLHLKTNSATSCLYRTPDRPRASAEVFVLH